MKQGYLGVDCGSVSVKAVILDKEHNTLKSCYLRNEGVIPTLKKVLANLNLENYEIIGCGVTGSGRDFVKVILSADLTKSEVLSHGIATLEYYPNVRTIFEIGGEDSKLMTLNEGVITNFRMNSICGGGTGSMIETIANKMNIKMEDIEKYALKSTSNIDLPGKCGIFCQSAVINKLNSGYKREDILMGVCRALIRNYLMLCRGINLKPPYVFQGATAKNKALVKSFEEELDYDVIVPDKCELMGAIGIAMIVHEEKIKDSKFKGIDVDSDFQTKSFKCVDCPNRCEVTQIFQDNEFLGGIGSKCGKWEKKEYQRLSKKVKVR
tara:strand:+ start:1754 stop:2722 length:969 start_codon:yes stop_codon:yes gene_type:complete